VCLRSFLHYTQFYSTGPCLGIFKVPSCPPLFLRFRGSSPQDGMWDSDNLPPHVGASIPLSYSVLFNETDTHSEFPTPAVPPDGPLEVSSWCAPPSPFPLLPLLLPTITPSPFPARTPCPPVILPSTLFSHPSAILSSPREVPLPPLPCRAWSFNVAHPSCFLHPHFSHTLAIPPSSLSLCSPFSGPAVFGARSPHVSQPPPSFSTLIEFSPVRPSCPGAT